MPFRTPARALPVLLILLSACRGSDSGEEPFEEAAWEHRSDAVMGVVGVDTLHAQGWDGSGQIIGITATGVDTEHPDLRGALHPHSTEYVADEDILEAIRIRHHGTLSAGFIAARRNGRGIYGTAPDAQILSVVIGQYPAVAPADTDQEFRHLLDRDVTAIMSGGFRGVTAGADTGSAAWTAFFATLDRMVENDVVMFIPAGNDAKPTEQIFHKPELAQKYGHLIIYVGAVNPHTLDRTSFSNLAGEVREQFVVMPGENIHSTTVSVDGNAYYAETQGTSFAAPLAIGVFASLREAFPHRSNSEIRDALFATARDLGEPGIDEIYGHGLLDAQAAYEHLAANP